MNGINLLTIFSTGLLTGGLTCIAVQGGLLTATLAHREEEKLKTKTNGHLLPVLSFLLAKLIIYTLLGFLLGWLGSLLHMSIPLQAALQFAVAIFMIGTALNLLNVHPIFRYFAIQPPRFLTRLIHKESKSRDLFAPALLGAFTVFIPCGTTQAMMALAIGSASPLLGGLILFIFTLGTSPVFFVVGYSTMKLGDILKKNFARVAAFAIILLALYMFNAAIVLTGSKWTFDYLATNLYCVVGYCNLPSGLTPVNDATITISANGYSPNQLAVKAGSKVTLHFVNTNGSGCTQAFTIPSLNLQKIIPVGTSGELTFTAPDKQEAIAFSCSAGFYPGRIQVI